MQVFLFVSSVEEVIMLSAPARAKVEGVQVKGTLRAFIHPGEDFHGYTYEELKTMGPGEHYLEPKSTPAKS